MKPAEALKSAEIALRSAQESVMEASGPLEPGSKQEQELHRVIDHIQDARFLLMLQRKAPS